MVGDTVRDLLAVDWCTHLRRHPAIALLGDSQSFGLVERIHLDRVSQQRVAFFLFESITEAFPSVTDEPISDCAAPT